MGWVFEGLIRKGQPFVAKSNKISGGGRKSGTKPVKKIVPSRPPERKVPGLDMDKPRLRKTPLSKKELLEFRELLFKPYRIIYEVDPKAKEITIHYIRPRSTAYLNL